MERQENRDSRGAQKTNSKECDLYSFLPFQEAHGETEALSVLDKCKDLRMNNLSQCQVAFVHTHTRSSPG